MPLTLQAILPLEVILAFIVGYVVYTLPFHVGVRCQRKGDTKNAERYYAMMLRLNPKFWLARYNRALILVNRRQYEDALKELDQVVQLSNGNFTSAYNLRGVAYAGLKQYALAAENYQTSLSWYTTRKLLAGANIGLAHVRFYEYQYHKPTTDPARDALLDQAIAYFDKALHIEPQNIYAISGKAQIYRHKGDPQKALYIYDRALERMPKSASLLSDRSVMHLSQNNFDATIADCTRAIQLDPKMSSAYNNRAYALIFKGELERALTDVNRSLALNPNSSSALNTRGVIYYLLDRQEEALRDFQQAINTAARDEQASAGVAIVLHHMGRWEEAKAQWQQLIALDETYRDANRLQKDDPIPPAFLEEAYQVAALVQTSDVLA